jgi:TPR repeat protein
MKRIFSNIVLAACLTLLYIVIAKPFIADAYYNAANRLAGASKPEKAQAFFEEAVKTEPFDSPHLSGFGRFLMKRSVSQTGLVRTYHLKKAAKLFERALALNRRDARSALNLGQTKLRLFLREKDEADKKEAFRYFRKALDNDPNGFNVSYLIGHAGLAVWDHLAADDRELILERLEFVLRMRPHFYNEIYRRLWRRSGDFSLLRRITPEGLTANRNLYLFLLDNNLSQFLKEQKRVVDQCREQEDPSSVSREKAKEAERIERIKKLKLGSPRQHVSAGEWKGKTADESIRYENGNMHWSGTVDAVVEIPAGEAVIQIMAAGSPANNVYPYMVVSLDGEEIGALFADRPGWTSYSFNIKTGGGIKVLSVSFVNDGVNEAKKEDRNLFVGEAKIETVR